LFALLIPLPQKSPHHTPLPPIPPSLRKKDKEKTKQKSPQIITSKKNKKNIPCMEKKANPKAHFENKKNHPNPISSKNEKKTKRTCHNFSVSVDDHCS